MEHRHRCRQTCQCRSNVPRILGSFTPAVTRPQRSRPSILELGSELRPWIFDVDEARTRRMAQVEEEQRHGPETAGSPW